MLKAKIQHLFGQSVPCPLPAGQSPEPLAAAQTSTPRFVFLPQPCARTAWALQSCRRAQEHCRGSQQVWHLLKRELKKKQKYLKSQKKIKISSNSRHSCCRINEVSIIIFSRSHTLQVLVQNKRFSMISCRSGSYFLHSNPSLRAAVHPQVNIDSHLFHTSESWSCTELEYQRCSIPGQQMQELPHNFNPGKALIVSWSNEKITRQFLWDHQQPLVHGEHYIKAAASQSGT